MRSYEKNIQHDILIPIKEFYLTGFLFIPADIKGIVIFAHGSGSGRFSPRNQLMANALNQANFATLLFDLLTEKEEQIDEVTRELRFNIPLLSERLLAATNWIITQHQFKYLPIGYFGASTGGGAALLAAAQDKKHVVRAVVSRGGRPDLAKEALSQVNAATLLIVGGEDDVVITLNQEAYEKLTCEKELTIIAGATHLFEEPGKLAEVAKAAITWFKKHLV